MSDMPPLPENHLLWTGSIPPPLPCYTLTREGVWCNKASRLGGLAYAVPIQKPAAKPDPDRPLSVRDQVRLALFAAYHSRGMTSNNDIDGLANAFFAERDWRDGV